MKVVENFTSVSDMPFKSSNVKGRRSKNTQLLVRGKNPRLKTPFTIFFIMCFFLFALKSLSYAAIKDYVVAFVDDTAITLSELNEVYSDSIKLNPEITKEEVLNSMINRILILREAKKLRLNATADEEILKEYISLRIRPHIKEEDVLDFYKKYVDNFQGKEFEAVREEIEHYLTEKEINKLLKNHIDKLRERAYIKMQLH